MYAARVCYIYIPWCVAEVLSCFPHTPFRMYLHIGVGKHSTCLPTGFSQDLKSGQVEMEAHVFLLCVFDNRLKCLKGLL